MPQRGYDQIVRYEACLDRAHRALYRAHVSATVADLEGAADDLYAMTRHVTTLLEESTDGRGKKRTAHPGQMTVYDVLAREIFQVEPDKGDGQ